METEYLPVGLPSGCIVPIFSEVRLQQRVRLDSCNAPVIADMAGSRLLKDDVSILVILTLVQVCTSHTHGHEGNEKSVSRYIEETSFQSCVGQCRNLSELFHGQREALRAMDILDGRFVFIQIPLDDGNPVVKVVIDASHVLEDVTYAEYAH